MDPSSQDDPGEEYHLFRTDLAVFKLFQHSRERDEPLLLKVEGPDAEECAAVLEEIFGGGRPSIIRAYYGLNFWREGARRRGLL